MERVELTTATILVETAIGGTMRRRRTGLLLAATGAVATLSLSAPPALAAGQGDGGGATIEEFICLRETGQEIRLGTGKVITTPSGNVHVACTAAPPSSL